MIKIVTDSTCDIPRATQKSMGIHVVPMTVFFEQRAYRDGLDMEHKEFYEKMEKAAKLPTTSQVNPGTFEDLFEDLVADGSSVIGIFVSSELSGTAHSAMIAATAVSPENIFIVDSRTVSLGLGLLVKEAVRQVGETNYTAPEIAKNLQILAKKARLFAVLDTFKNLKMGGRLSAGTAAVGGLLGIKPIVEIVDGRVVMAGKVRGDKAAIRFLSHQLKEHPPQLSYGFAFGHGYAKPRMNEYINQLCNHIPGCKYDAGWIGAAIGTHAGSGVVGIAYFDK
ncbi:MAG: DegV family protein [Eubacteriales bacterium]